MLSIKLDRTHCKSYNINSKHIFAILVCPSLVSEKNLSKLIKIISISVHNMCLSTLKTNTISQNEWNLPADFKVISGVFQGNFGEFQRVIGEFRGIFPLRGISVYRFWAVISPSVWAYVTVRKRFLQ